MLNLLASIENGVIKSPVYTRNFDVTIVICLCRRGNLANFYVTRVFAEKLAC